MSLSVALGLNPRTTCSPHAARLLRRGCGPGVLDKGILHARSPVVFQKCGLRCPQPPTCWRPVSRYPMVSKLSRRVRRSADQCDLQGALPDHRVGSTSSFQWTIMGLFPPHCLAPRPCCPNRESVVDVVNANRWRAAMLLRLPPPALPFPRLYILEAEITRHASRAGHVSHSGCFKARAA